MPRRLNTPEQTSAQVEAAGQVAAAATAIDEAIGELRKARRDLEAVGAHYGTGDLDRWLYLLTGSGDAEAGTIPENLHDLARALDAQAGIG